MFFFYTDLTSLNKKIIALVEQHRDHRIFKVMEPTFIQIIRDHTELIFPATAPYTSPLCGNM